MRRTKPLTRSLLAACLLLRAGLGAAGANDAAAAADDVARVDAGAPTTWAVTVYRAPSRAEGQLQLNGLAGFALITETRSVSLPAGETRIRFAGVADGIEPASAIITGLPSDVVEKNLDAAVLSPAALVAAALGRSVEILRTNPKTGRTEHSRGTIRSDNEGVIFEGADGIEALRCSGLPETFRFDGPGELAATPTLSTVVRSDRPVAATVTLSYLAHGFDWTADYVATLAADGRHMDLGAWVTLANGNAAGFPDAHTQVVAGRVNHETGDVEPFDDTGEIIARCWPRGRTSDPVWPAAPAKARERGLMFLKSVAAGRPMAAAPMADLQEVIVTGAKRVEQEQLGDLKLYRVPEPTTVASRQIKQVRLIDKADIPIELYYEADLAANQSTPAFAATRKLRTRNDAAHHLDVPLPSGQVASFEVRGEQRLLLAEAPLRDIAVGEKVELALGTSPDVEVTAMHDRRDIAAGVEDSGRVEVSNARDAAIAFELRLRLDPGASLVSADQTIETKDGRPWFRFVVPAGGTITVHFRTRQVRPRPAPR